MRNIWWDNDIYAKLTIVDIDVHILVHATRDENLNKYLKILQLGEK